MEAFNDDMAAREFEKLRERIRITRQICTPKFYWMSAWHCLRDLFATKAFVPREPVVVHGPRPEESPAFPHIIPERKIEHNDH